MRLVPPKRFRVAWGIAWTASILAAAVAIGPNIGGPLHQELVVLTLTLIAVIWYTYFTFRAVNREPPSYLKTGLQIKGGPEAVVVRPHIHNPTVRTIHARVWLDLWLDHQQLLGPPFYAGEEEVTLGPDEGFAGFVELRDELKHVERDDYGDFRPTGQKLKARLQVRWTDDLEETGVTPPKHWVFDVDAGRMVYVVAPSNIKRFFEHAESQRSM